jgi:hypothetical protein
MLGSQWAGLIGEAEIEMPDPYAPAVTIYVRAWEGGRRRPVDRRVMDLVDMVDALWAEVLTEKYAEPAAATSEGWAMSEEDLVLLRRFAEVVHNLGILVSPRTTPYRILRERTRALLWSAGDPSTRRVKAALTQTFASIERSFARGIPRPAPPDVPRRGNLYLVR